jgi:glycosyltransferase involved in cell wall biosynthesis
MSLIMNNKYSIVIPVFNNQGSLSILFDLIMEKVIKQFTDSTFEVIMIDDGSSDNSLNELLELKSKFPNYIKIIKFTRNFGQLAAIMAGYNNSTGKCVINISADLQDPPELISEMIKYFEKDKYEIVICTRINRDEGFIRKSTSKLFYNLIRKLSFRDMPLGGFDYVLLSERAKRIVLESKEANPFWQGQILWMGFKIKYIPYKRLMRPIGKSAWTLSKKIKMLIDGILGYSYLPIRLMSFLGLIIALLGFTYAIVIFFEKIFGRVPFKGWAPIIILILVLSGIQMLMLGIIGEYLWRTLDQVKSRPHYIIENIYD